MEDFYWNTVYTEEIRQWYRDNIDGLRQSQPDAYDFSLALADMLGLEVAQTFAVSNVAETATFCTSIVARNARNEIVHARNIDFWYTEHMKKLVFTSVIV